MHIFSLIRHPQKSVKKVENKINPIFSAHPSLRECFVSSTGIPGFPSDLFLSFVTHTVLPDSSSLTCLVALHTFLDTEAAKVTMRISKVTEEIIHSNNTPNLVLNIPKHVSTWQIIILLDSFLLRMHRVKLFRNASVNANWVMFENQQRKGSLITYSLEFLYFHGPTDQFLESPAPL